MQIASFNPNELLNSFPVLSSTTVVLAIITLLGLNYVGLLIQDCETER